jgi:hypothetical protein
MATIAAACIIDPPFEVVMIWLASLKLLQQ